jgi:glyoxalase family protein
MKRGRVGNGETAATAYAISPESVGFWQGRLADLGLNVGDIETRFGAEVIPLDDPDGLRLELAVSEEPATCRHWAEGPISQQHALRGFHGVTLWLAEVEPTGQLLTDRLGYEFVGQEGNRYRYRGASNDLGLYVDLLHRPDQPAGKFGAGSIHHIAFRTVDDAKQLEYQSLLAAAGFGVTEVRDRQYFHSIYFRSPGGVLFEIATDAPGFLIDEPVDKLGQSLKLPPWLEPRRAEIEQRLPSFTLNPVSQVAEPEVTRG